MRRGGRAIYAFDVSTPTAPTLKWRKGCFTNSTSDDSNCSTGWSGIGQTWSKPQMGFIQGYVDGSGIPKPVIVMGGGYDTCEDAPGADGNGTQTRCATTPRKGANVWVIDADTGALLRVYPTNYSVPGDVHLYKDSNDYIRFIYAGDTGGYVYRINVGTYDGTAVGTFDWTASGWTANTAAANITIAALSETNHARKFLFGPDVIRYGGYYYVLVGTGDRERPLAANYPCSNYSATAGNYVTNQFFGLKDVPSSYPATPVVPADLTDVTDLSALPVVGLRGWRLQLNACEQVVNKPLTVAGVTYFGTNQPAQSVANSCVTNLGTARAYGVDFETGGLPLGKTSRSMELLGGGLPPSAVAGVADVDGQKTPFCLGCGADPYKPSPLEGSEVEVNPSGPRQRLYWYMLTD
jgi:type IV pilus assembly protein PilY1